MHWLARGEAAIPRGLDWLDDAERDRAMCMRFTKRRTEYLLRRLAGKAAVAAVLGLPDDDATLGRIAVRNAPTGAPYVEVDGARVDWDVSLTDRAGWAVCLVGPDLGAVGCDLELVEPRSAGFVRDFLTDAEQSTVAEAQHEAGGDGHATAANLIWSAKESALKVMRTGLRADTRTVEVRLAGANLWAAPVNPGDATRAASAADGSGGWSSLSVDTPIGVLPGWWRREGVLLLTVVTGGARGRSGAGDRESARPPDVLPGSTALASAVPVHSWLERPIVE